MDLTRVLLQATRDTLVVDTPRLPWQGSSMVSFALGAADPLFPTPMPVRAYVPLTSGVKRPSSLAYIPEHRRKRRRLSDSVAAKCPDDARALVIQKWLAVLEVNLTASSSGACIVKFQEDDDAEERLKELLDDIFATKATGTLRARCTALLLYVKWHIGQKSEVEAFPLKEDMAYKYVSHLRRTGAPATRASSFLEGWNFAVFALGFEDPDEVSSSLRCKGSAHRQASGKKPRKRAKELSVPMVVTLEFAAVFETNCVRKALAGYACLCFFGRFRSSDGNCLAGIDEDEEYLEGCLLGNKTSKSSEKKTTLLPAVVPRTGLPGLGWWAAFVKYELSWAFLNYRRS